MKKSPITLTAIRNVLRDCQFNPKLVGPMSVIVDANDPKYWEFRAIEQIKEIHQYDLDEQETKDRLELAIRLIALSLAERIHRGQNSENLSS